MQRFTLFGFALVLCLLARPLPVDAALLETGADFPSWEMQDHTGKRVRAADLAGKTYLLWYYPKAQTPGCTIEGRQLRDRYPDFAQRGVEVLGVSFDSPAENAAFVEAEGFPYRLLSDDGTLAAVVGAQRSGGLAYPKRISYLVGPDGRVLRGYASVDPQTHAAEVLSDLDEKEGDAATSALR